MDIGKSFRFVFEDKDWVSKLLIGVLVSLVPILNFAFMGYLVQLVLNVSEGIAHPLPDWSDFGDKFVKGLIMVVAGFIYALPIVILIGIMGGTGALADLSTGGEISDVAGALLAGVGVLFACLIALYGLALIFFYYGMTIHFSREGTFGSCFQIGKIINLISSNLGEYLTAWLVSLLFGFVLTIAAGIAFTFLSIIICIGWILMFLLAAFLTVWPNIVIFHLFGQVGALDTVAE
ncbi:MAG: DUF4013 domain-containing protein [Chloroflexota bacterium]|nr:DUF4013 domain-containing protein [Chloroflexota bacterium]